MRTGQQSRRVIGSCPGGGGLESGAWGSGQLRAGVGELCGLGVENQQRPRVEESIGPPRLTASCRLKTGRTRDLATKAKYFAALSSIHSAVHGEGVGTF